MRERIPPPLPREKEIKIIPNDYTNDRDLILAISQIPDGLDKKLDFCTKAAYIVDKDPKKEEKKVALLQEINRFLAIREEIKFEISYTDKSISSMKREDILALYKETLKSNPIIGKGRTAEIRVTKLEGIGDVVIKSILTPIKGTLNSIAESTLIKEVKTIISIDQIEDKKETPNLSVPHPYLSISSISNYGSYIMQKVSGFDLERTLAELDDWNKMDKDDDIQIPEWIEKIAQVDKKDISRQIDVFVNKMHKICLHGDIKLANMMFDIEDGKAVFYIIDFGQSVSPISIEEKNMNAFNNLQKSEVENIKSIIIMIINKATEVYNMFINKK